MLREGDWIPRAPFQYGAIVQKIHITRVHTGNSQRSLEDSARGDWWFGTEAKLSSPKCQIGRWILTKSVRTKKLQLQRAKHLVLWSHVVQFLHHKMVKDAQCVHTFSEGPKIAKYAEGPTLQGLLAESAQVIQSHAPKSLVISKQQTTKFSTKMVSHATVTGTR